jgi:hypothetical protein
MQTAPRSTPTVTCFFATWWSCCCWWRLLPIRHLCDAPQAALQAPTAAPPPARRQCTRGSPSQQLRPLPPSSRQPLPARRAARARQAAATTSPPQQPHALLLQLPCPLQPLAAAPSPCCRRPSLPRAPPPPTRQPPPAPACPPPATPQPAQWATRARQPSAHCSPPQPPRPLAPLLGSPLLPLTSLSWTSSSRGTQSCQAWRCCRRSCRACWRR